MSNSGGASDAAAGGFHERDLAESADDLYENAPCGYLTTDESGTIVRVNQTFLSWTGYAREELLGKKRILDLLAPGDRIYYETHLAPLLRMQGAVREIAAEVVRADGGRLPVLLNFVVQGDPGTSPLLVRTTVFDATDRRRYEQELLRARREAEDRARAALAVAHVNDGVLLVDPDGRVLLLNPAGAAILGVAAEAVAGHPVADAVPGWSALVERIPVGAPDRWPTPATLPFARAGEDAWIKVAAVDAGDGIVYTFHDVTADHRLEELRSEIVAVVSHELRTPLATMYGAAQTLLRRPSVEDALRDQLLATIVEQGEAQGRVLDAVALTDRLDAEDVDLGEEPFDAGELAAAVVAAFDERSGGSHRIVLDRGDPVEVRGDRATAEQVVANLLDNALKYTPAGSRVSVAVRRLDRWGRLTVADEGPGIPADERELVFEKFYRVDPQQRSGVSGIGLGLYIARELVSRMHGRIGILPSDRGATFFVDLPLAR